MNVRTIGGVVCLASALIVQICTAKATAPCDIVNGKITVPSKDIIFKGPFTLPPDALGGFQIEIKLPQKSISATECGPDDGLVVQMGDAEPIDTDLQTPKNLGLVKKKLAFLHDLMEESHKQNMVTFSIQGKSTELRYRNGKLYAPYCAVAFSGYDK